MRASVKAAEECRAAGINAPRVQAHKPHKTPRISKSRQGAKKVPDRLVGDF